MYDNTEIMTFSVFCHEAIKVLNTQNTALSFDMAHLGFHHVL